MTRRKPTRTRDLADALTARCAAVVERLGPVEAPITAGLDSRLILAVLRAGEIKADFQTDGEPDDADVIAATRIADLVGVPHTVWPRPATEIQARWDELARRLVVQNDGMVSLWQAPGTIRPLSSRPAVAFTGVGGEIARGFYTHLDDFAPGRRGGIIERFVARRARGHGLLTPEGLASARGQVLASANDLIARGAAAVDVPDAFYVFERVGRWASAAARSCAPSMPFAPLATTTWIEAAFGLSPAERWTAPLHDDLLRLLAPDLRAFPVAGGWRPRGAARNIARATARRIVQRRSAATAAPPKRDALIGPLRPALAARCLDRASSPLWQVIDRRGFEKLMLGDGPAQQLLGVVTLFEHEIAMERV